MKDGLVVYRWEVDVLATDAGGPVEPQTIFGLWLAKDKRSKMLGSAWVITYYDALRDGYWPEIKPEQIPRRGGLFRHAPHEIPGIFAAEVSTRAAMCGSDGQLMWAYYHDGKDGDIHLISRALLYCAGWQRKRRSYKDWYQRDYTRGRSE